MTKLLSKTLLGPTQKRPTRSFKEAREEAREREKVGKDKGIDKRVTALKLPSTVQKHEDGGFDGTIMHPTDEQLEKINRFTRSTKSAEELVCFPTLSCNDIIDRDFDQFTTDTVKEFASLPEPYSSVGKSYMVGHDYSKLPVGRIFDVDTKKVGDDLFLSNWVYMPNTEANKEFIEKVDFGINWAVSVGVMLEASACAICDSPVSRFGFCYDQGHIKGYYYDPKSTETDDWGWAEPVEPDSKGASLCFTKMSGAKDFYELSQVFLGAQYFAAVDEKSSLGGIIKAASAAEVPVIGLSKEEAKELPIPHVPEAVKEAHEKYETDVDEEGQVFWTDSDNLRWVFDPEQNEVLCLGRTNKEEAGDATTDTDGQSGDPSKDGTTERQSDESGDGTSSDELGTSDSGSGTSESDEQPKGVRRESVEDAESSSGSKAVESKEDDMKPEAIRALAVKHHVPEEVLEEAEKSGGSLLESLIKQLVTRNMKLAAKAEVGENYLKQLRADAVDWYVKAHQEDEDSAVNTETFQRFLDACGDDIDLIKSLIDEKKALAQARFPKAVRRSTFQTDPNSKDGPTPTDEWDPENDERVSRLHG